MMENECPCNNILGFSLTNIIWNFFQHFHVKVVNIEIDGAKKSISN